MIWTSSAIMTDALLETSYGGTNVQTLADALDVNNIVMP